MQTTNNLGLKKPGDDDFINVEDLNHNADILDSKVKEIVENIESLSGLKDSIQLTTDSEFVNSLIYNTAKAGSVLLFSNIGERYGNVTGADYSLYAALGNCNQYSGCDITVKPINEENEQSLHPMFFQSPNFFIAKVDKQNAKRVVIYPLGGGNVEELRERLRGVEEKANQAFTQAGEGKKAIVNAFTGLGISANSNETFKSLADKIKTKTLNKFKVANALTNKGVLTSTTATDQQIIQKINSINILDLNFYGIDKYISPSDSFPKRTTNVTVNKQKTKWDDSHRGMCFIFVFDKPITSIKIDMRFSKSPSNIQPSLGPLGGVYGQYTGWGKGRDDFTNLVNWSRNSNGDSNGRSPVTASSLSVEGISSWKLEFIEYYRYSDVSDDFITAQVGLSSMRIHYR